MYCVLIVDDEEHLVESLAETTDWSRMSVSTVHKAYSGEQALDIMKSSQVDIVITDIKMPELTGIELIEIIHERWKKVKCILLTGYSDFNFAKQAIKFKATDYLLKPVETEELEASVTQIIAGLREEWGRIASYQQAVSAIKENLPLLKSNLLHDLLQGKKIDFPSLEEKMALLEMPFSTGDSLALLLIRMEGTFVEYDYHTLSLMEYAVGNIAAEVFADQFWIWIGKDPHDYLTMLVKPKYKPDAQDKNTLLELKAGELQRSVQMYLKGRISVLVSSWFGFPDELTATYRNSIGTLRQLAGSEDELVITMNSLTFAESSIVERLYEPPLLTVLLESARWDAFREKVSRVIDELETRWSDSYEHIMEAFFVISGAFTYIVHKNGWRFFELMGNDHRILDTSRMTTVKALREWTYRALDKIIEESEKGRKDNRQMLIGKIQAFIQEHLYADLTSHMIAECVNLNPAYVSRVYKLETGESITEYIFRLKMEEAAYLLKYSDKKIYEISGELRYQNPQYFSKLFRRQYNMSPQEYRDAMHRCSS